MASTLSGNSAFFGGGIYGGSTTVSYSTLSGNTAREGGNIGRSGIVSLRNSIVVAGSAGGNCEDVAQLTSRGNNLSDTTSCFPGGTQGDIVTTTPLLGPLALHGPGTAKTHALLPGSPAIDGVTFNPTDCPGQTGTDQRGLPVVC